MQVGEGDSMYECTECNFRIDVGKKCPECYEACPVCGGEMEQW